MWYYSSKKYCAVKALKHQPLFCDKFIEQYPRLLLYKQKLLNDAKVDVLAMLWSHCQQPLAVLDFKSLDYRTANQTAEVNLHMEF